MSYSNLIIGSAVIAGGLQIALTAVLPDQQPIVVHTLTYEAGRITQDRTINSDEEFFPAQWRAFIFDADTNRPVDECSGSGFWPYPAGRASPNMDIPTWTGRDECTVDFLVERGGSYYPVASWHWGNDFEKARGDVFTPTAEDIPAN